VASFGVLLVAFSLSSNLFLSAAILAPAGFTLMIQMSGSNTLLQTVVPDRMRGRVMSFYSMSLMGMSPFGSLFAGAVATRIGAPRTVAVGGVLCLIGAVVFRFYLPGSGDDAVVGMIDQEPSTVVEDGSTIGIDGGS
jgi:MFS family permease